MLWPLSICNGVLDPGLLQHLPVQDRPVSLECSDTLEISRLTTFLHSYPVIYTTTDWWKTCTGNNSGFGTTSPLWIARYASTIGTLPAGWSFHTFWQYADHGANPGDANVFNGDLSGLKRYMIFSPLRIDMPLTLKPSKTRNKLG